MEPFTQIGKHYLQEKCCLLSPEKLLIYQIPRFSNLHDKDKCWFMAYCGGQEKKSCVMNSPDETHDVFLLAEDALLKVSASLALIAHLSDEKPESMIHIFHVKKLEVSRGTVLARDKLPMANFLSSTGKWDLVLGSGSVLLSSENLSCWTELSVSEDTLLSKAMKKFVADSTSPPERVMHVYYLQCFCKDRGPHLAHGRFSLDHVYVELCHQENGPDRKTIVVVTEKTWAIMKGNFESITKLYPLQDASDLDDDRLHWFKSKIEFVQWLDCHDPGASV
ncbi:hypothetical protein KCU66_g3549, partial [Aureobasidium melanogenum]